MPGLAELEEVVAILDFWAIQAAQAEWVLAAAPSMATQQAGQEDRLLVCQFGGSLAAPVVLAHP